MQPIERTETMRPVRERRGERTVRAALFSGVTALAALAFALPAAAAEDCNAVEIAFDKPSYLPGETFELSICGTPGTLLGLMLDREGGPIYIPGWGTFEVSGSSSFVLVPLPPIPAEGCLRINAALGCGSPLLDVPIYTQVLSYDVGTEEFCLSNGAVLRVDSDAETCSSSLEGCTPGHWRNSVDKGMWEPTGLDPSMLYNDVFAVSDFPDLTLGDALLPGGKLMSFQSQSVAALLNARDPETNYGMTEIAVVTTVQDLLASDPTWAELKAVKDMFETYNKMGCH